MSRLPIPRDEGAWESVEVPATAEARLVAWLVADPAAPDAATRLAAALAAEPALTDWAARVAGCFAPAALPREPAVLAAWLAPRLVEVLALGYAGWHAQPPEASDLASLATRLGRLHALEAHFEQTLRDEKLASLAEWAAGAGHEMNNPLAVISGRAQLLERDEADPERRRELVLIQTQAVRVHEMIAELMLFARPPLAPMVETDLTQLAGRVVAEARERAEARSVRLDVELGERPAVARVDATAWCVAAGCLLDNALEAVVGGSGQIRVTLARLGPVDVPGNLRLAVWRLEVADNGPGLSEAARRHACDPFYSGRQAGRGLGTGLSKAWRIAVAHGGCLTVASRPEGGALVRLDVPAPQVAGA